METEESIWEFLMLNYHRSTKVGNREHGDSAATLRSWRISRRQSGSRRADDVVQMVVIRGGRGMT